MLDATWLNFWARGQAWYDFWQDGEAAGAEAPAVSAGRHVRVPWLRLPLALQPVDVEDEDVLLGAI